MTRPPLDPPTDFICGSSALMSRTRFTAAERKATSDARAQWIIDRYVEGYPRAEIADALKFATITSLMHALNGRPMPPSLRPESDPKRRAYLLGLKLGNIDVALKDHHATAEEIRKMAKLTESGGHPTLADMLVTSLLTALRNE